MSIRGGEFEHYATRSESRGHRRRRANEKGKQHVPSHAVHFVEAAAARWAVPGWPSGCGRTAGRLSRVSRRDRASRTRCPSTADTLFVIGSVTKTYTATALMRLVAEGRVAAGRAGAAVCARARACGRAGRGGGHRAATCSTTPRAWTGGSSATSAKGTTHWPATSARLAGLRWSRRRAPGPPTARRGSTWPGGSWRRSPG